MIKKQSHGCLQGNKPHGNSPEPSEPCLRNLHQHALELFGTLRNRPNPAFGTYTNTRRNSPEPSGTFQDLPESTFRNFPKPTSGTYASIPWNSRKSSGTFREFASGTYTILHRNSPEPSATCLQNSHHFTPELSGTFRNPPPEPTPAHTGTLRNLPEPASGTHTSTRRNSPEPSGTFRNLPPEPAPATRTGTHRSLSGLKTPLAYAVGEKSHWVAENEKINRFLLVVQFSNSRSKICDKKRKMISPLSQGPPRPNSGSGSARPVRPPPQ